MHPWGKIDSILGYMRSIFLFFQVVGHGKLLHVIEVDGLELSRSHIPPLSVI